MTRTKLVPRKYRGKLSSYRRHNEATSFDDLYAPSCHGLRLPPHVCCLSCDPAFGPSWSFSGSAFLYFHVTKTRGFWMHDWMALACREWERQWVVRSSNKRRSVPPSLSHHPRQVFDGLRSRHAPQHRPFALPSTLAVLCVQWNRIHTCIQLPFLHEPACPIQIGWASLSDPCPRRLGSDVGLSSLSIGRS